ncbi:MAG: endonuclease Q family protein [Promethearchaeota archaeon]
MDLPNLVLGARQKGLQLVGTGDCFQPEWMKYLKSNLARENGEHKYKDINFILQTEIESDSIHQIIIFPDFETVDVVKKKFLKHSSNINGRWGGRPVVKLPLPEIVEVVDDAGALIGPAHAFTPFKSIFKQGKYSSLKDAYGSKVKYVHFLELGLSANSDYADRIKDLHGVTFLSNSDAHSPSPRSLGREFNTFLAESLEFEEIEMAIRRKNGRKFTRNVGLDPRLGKYNVLFCLKCRRRVILKLKNRVDRDTGINLVNSIKFDDEIIEIEINSNKQRMDYLKAVEKGKILCPACLSVKKKSKIKLGVSERIELIADTPMGVHPPHRPPYINIVPLTEILRVAMKIKSKTSTTLGKIYNDIIDRHGPEIHLLLEIDLDELSKSDLQVKYKKYKDLFKRIKLIIETFRENKVSFKPGGGGTFGELIFEA